MALTYKHKIGGVLGVDESKISTYWKGRVGFYAILKAFSIKKDDEVIIPAFTCVVVPNAIIYLGAKPIYVDINKQTYNTTLKHIKEAVTPKTKCIVIQNTFGLSSEMEEIITFAKEQNILTIEDCTHGFGGEYNGRPNGTYADASFFSTQWNKPFSTGIGGFVYMKNDKYLPIIKEVDKELIKPSTKEVTMLRSLFFLNSKIVTPKTYWFLIKTYRTLSKKGIVVGSSSGEEISSTTEPKNYFKALSKFQEKKGEKNITNIESLVSTRLKNAIVFNEFLLKNNKTGVDKTLFKNHSFLKFPILVNNRIEFKENAEKANIKLGDWFVSMIHPIETNFENWNLFPEEYPVANKISQKVLNLDTSTNDVNKVIRFLEENLDNIN
jgi:dTDP-4-amino-4,6-dideoxygalactose transaminase